MIRLLRLALVLLALPAGAALADPPAYAPVTPGRMLAFPRDYGAHPDHRTEWWYVTGWLRTPDGETSASRSRSSAAARRTTRAIRAPSPPRS